MNRIFLSLLTVVLIAIVSCKSVPDNKVIADIQKAEKELYSTEVLDWDKGTAMIQKYVDFAKQYPADSLSAAYLFKAADLAMNLKLGSQSVLYFDKILTNYPSFSKAPEALFLKGFVLENELHRLEQAGITYKLFLDKYPNHVLAKDARASLDNLGKSPEELIKMFEEKHPVKPAPK